MAPLCTPQVQLLLILFFSLCRTAFPFPDSEHLLLLLAKKKGHHGLDGAAQVQGRVNA